MEKTKNLYLDFFQLKEAPFKITPTASYFYGGGKRGEILHALLYAINSGEGIMMVSGEVGSGKTMLLRTLIERLDPKTDIIYIANPSLSGREILYNICEELGLESEENRPDTVRILQNHLIKRHQEGHRVVAFIDEAQAMPDESLEEIRLLSNLETSRDKLLQIALFGQPELEEKLLQQKLRQLRERITVAIKLKPFSRQDIEEYITTRLHAAGYQGAALFNKDAYQIIFAVSKGISRRINVLADKALLSAYARGSAVVEKIDAKRAAQDVSYGKLLYRSEEARRLSRTATVALASCCALFFAVIFYFAYDRAMGGDYEQVEGNYGQVVVTDNNEVDAPAPEEAPDSIAEDADSVTTDIATITPPAPEKAAPTNLDTLDTPDTPDESFGLIDDNPSPPLDATTPEPLPVAEAVTVQIPAEPVTATVVETVVIKTISVVTVQAPPPAEVAESLAFERANVAQNNSANIKQEMSQAIANFQLSNQRISGEELAMEIAQNAEEHEDLPQSEGGGVEWQQVANNQGGSNVLNNEQWTWMPASSYLRSRLNATQTWLQSEKNQQQYTARLMTVSQERAIFLEKFLRFFADYYPVRNVLVYPLQLKSGKKFVLTFGLYPSRHEAEVFIRNVPRYFTGGRPFAQPVAQMASESQGLW